MALFDKMRKSNQQISKLILSFQKFKVGNTDVEEVDRHGNGEIFCLSPNFVIFYVTHLTDYSREKGMDLFTDEVVINLLAGDFDKCMNILHAGN